MSCAVIFFPLVGTINSNSHILLKYAAIPPVLSKVISFNRYTSKQEHTIVSVIYSSCHTENEFTITHFTVAVMEYCYVLSGNILKLTVSEFLQI